MADSEKNLTPKQHAAIAALLTERDTRSAASACDIPERTLYSWLNLPEFQSALYQAEREAIDTACRRLAGAAGSALDTLEEIMTDIEQAAGVRVRAASVVLEQLVKLRELLNLENRVAELEKKVSENEA